MKHILFFPLVFITLLAGCTDTNSDTPNSNNVNSSVILQGVDYGYSAFIDINKPPTWKRWLAITQSDGTLNLNIGVKNPNDGKIDPVMHVVISKVPNALGTHTTCTFNYQPYGGGISYFSYPSSESLTVSLTSIANNSGEFYEGTFNGPVARLVQGPLTQPQPFNVSGSFRIMKE